MNTTTKTLDVKILDKDLRIACPDDEREALLDAVAFLDRRMREIREAGKIASTERIALMAALNITHELLNFKVGKGIDLGDFKRRIGNMQAAIDTALAEQDKLF